MPESSKQNSKDNRPPAPQSRKPKRKRGRPAERVVKIDDSPRNVARAFFGIRSTKYSRPKS